MPGAESSAYFTLRGDFLKVGIDDVGLYTCRWALTPNATPFALFTWLWV